MFRFLLGLLAFVGFLETADAQEWMKVHRSYNGLDWTVPIEYDKMSTMDYSSDYKTFRINTMRQDETEMVVPFSVSYLDSITFANSLTDAEKGHNKYRPFVMNIATEGGTGVAEKEEWVNCFISIDGRGEYSDFSGSARIRGRGNSTWEWYDKKPYKFKLDSKSKLLGLDKAKNWNLLANYRDVTDMMNVFAFEVARCMNMPHTNHTRFVEVFLDGEYIGIYQLTEKIEVNKNRVDIDEDEGIMLSFDMDDGPSLSPDAIDNFWSSVYSLPVCVKYPEDPSAEVKDSIKADFANLEKAIKAHNYEVLDSLLDIPSFIGILQMHEYLYNVEIDAPRSIYLYKDKGGKYTFGPVWDWDAGYDFDWSDMYTGHTFFSSTSELIYGTDPLNGTGASYSINKFWRDMFSNATFVKQYKDAWAAVSDTIFTSPWAETKKYSDQLTLSGAFDRDCAKWQLKSSSSNPWSGNQTSTTFVPATELNKMEKWLKSRKSYIDNVIKGYPAGTDDSDDPDDIVEVSAPVVTYNSSNNTINVNVKAAFSSDYTQSYQIEIDEDELTAMLGGTPTSLYPLNADGSTGTNTAAGMYGAWFDDDGTCGWGNGAHVYIEANDFYTWSYGCHPDNCSAKDEHTVRLKYQRRTKSVIVTIKFTII